MKLLILTLLPIICTGCANNCQKLAQNLYVPDTIPKEMGIIIDEKNIQADDNGSKFLTDYVKARTELQALVQECKK